MVTFPMPDSEVLRRRSDAMRYLKLFKRHTKARAERFVADVLAIEGDLREPVAFVCDALARGCAHFEGQHLKTDKLGLGHGMKVEHVDIDEDLLDAYIDRFGEDPIEEAARWILRRLQGESSILVSWALGPIRFPVGKGRHHNVLEHRVLYNLEERRFQAVLSHPQWNHPECQHFLVDGGTRKRARPVG